ncbi:bile acid:sodium symporter family protein [Exilibacterium tricleocarpae]|uniref:Bile acid:sodium symporter family protein n=1 Tax=Exilibacterium tricleocarpae TaxID=2591008 RepID=A0A545TNV4_9GAMM|nr:bile acid:sodium symporter [Exilibacterium tricleocarpae]TQV78892.1 bile acid:sodium symporter family protein [Exilibacterium tricleocarpae]
MTDFYITHEYWFAVFQLVMAMFGMGATLTVKDFGEVIMEPKAVTIGNLVQLLLVPVVAYLFILGFGLTGGIAIGIALLAAIPGGTSSNMFTFFARGNIALSISITAITTLACLLTTPLILELLISRYMPADFVMPRGQIISEIFWTLLLPLLLGMVVLRTLPNHAEWIARWSIRASLLGILAIVVFSVLAGRLDAQAFGLTNILLIAALLVILTAAAWAVPVLFGLPLRDATAIEMEVAVRNVNLGLLIKTLLFPATLGQADPLGDTVLFSLLLFGGAQLLMGAGLIAWRRRAMLKTA